ncbi:L-tryptophan--pyruvate aminotransferase 1-like [Rutidosis leptorrhynchoides]|uniref:L-tryptophan--pyruvate aminotransferase 1-like n=1 Tax=Rutidosis leptorrhynchoides TaxID=125765 RepID=UPI003A9A0907
MDAYLGIADDSSDDELLLNVMGAYAEVLDREADEGPSQRPPRAPRRYLHRDREGSNNDITVLNRSPLFDSIKNGTAAIALFTVNGHEYTHGYYLTEGINEIMSPFSLSAPTSCSINDEKDDITHDIKTTSLVFSSALCSKNDDVEVQDGDVVVDDGVVIDLDHGDPTMYEEFWKKKGEETTVVISGWQFMSYFSDIKNVCWFLESTLAAAVTRLHKVIGNAVTDSRHIVVGTGSSQLYQAALYALSSPESSEPLNVVSAAPFYSSYVVMTDYLKSGLHKWSGDAYKFDHNGKPYIEVVTSPNNPDGSKREAVVNGDKGSLIYDLAYYWPQYTPILGPADYDIMLFTVSKITGHAGSRIGWAIVKDGEIAKKMTKFVEINSIGVSKESQIRAAKILETLSDSVEMKESETFFDHSYELMSNRWKKLREAISHNKLFSLPEFPINTCLFSRRTFGQFPAFAWLKCEEEVGDCESFLRGYKIKTRSGKLFGVGAEYVRVSMLSRESEFKIFLNQMTFSINRPLHIKISLMYF